MLDNIREADNDERTRNLYNIANNSFWYHTIKTFILRNKLLCESKRIWTFDLLVISKTLYQTKL